MALYTDSPVFTIEDLAGHETGLLDTAGTEGIDLTTKIKLAIEEVGLQLLSALRRLAPDPVGLKQVVVTTPLRLWQIFHTLELTYRDAYYNQLNDRYKAKWDEYKDLSKWASGLLYQIGVGTVMDPVPEAQAALLSVDSGTLAASKFFVRTAWLNAGGEEGAASGFLESITLTAPGGIRVTAVNPPANATRWNAYAGVSPHDLLLQNTTPVTMGQTLTIPGPTLAAGRRPGTGQEPVFLRQVPQIFQRG